MSNKVSLLGLEEVLKDLFSMSSLTALALFKMTVTEPKTFKGCQIVV